MLAAIFANAPGAALVWGPFLLTTLPNAFANPFRPMSQIPGFVRWLRWIIPISYSYELMPWFLFRFAERDAAYLQHVPGSSRSTTGQGQQPRQGQLQNTLNPSTATSNIPGRSTTTSAFTQVMIQAAAPLQHSGPLSTSQAPPTSQQAGSVLPPPITTASRIAALKDAQGQFFEEEAETQRVALWLGLVAGLVLLYRIIAGFALFANSRNMVKRHLLE
ncbi:unnamed protein product [Amoebophrya sp. A25]|nr:unnamed protein product [Amoebophrya sp. A25]|eukprot:GSA25T00023907001.1